MKNVLFLDYDDVVNKAKWTNIDGEWTCRYNFPEDGSVNDYDAVQWVSEFCQRYNYSIVVSSTWRRYSNYKECLINGGLRKEIEIDGSTPYVHGNRGKEIGFYLKDHPEITGFLIFDDMNEEEFGDVADHLVRCDNGSFGWKEYEIACDMHTKFYGSAI